MQLLRLASTTINNLKGSLYQSQSDLSPIPANTTLNKPIAINNAQVTISQTGEIEFSSPDDSGAGIFNIDPIFPKSSTNPTYGAGFLKVEYSLSSGKIYAQVFESAFAKQISSLYSDKDNSGEIYVFLEEQVPEAVLMIGTLQSGSQGKIEQVTWIPKASMDTVQYKKIRARSFEHWYYSTDLGDGIRHSLTVPDEQTIMEGLIRNRANCLYMVNNYIGNLAGLKILDLACSAGFHAFELARQGAIVTAIDWDRGAIEQAKFVQECIQDELPHKIEFHCADVFEFEVPKNYFDYVYCSGLMYHLPNPIGAAKRIRDFCSQGVIISSCVTPKEGDLFELSDPSKFPFCASWEFAFVPTATMLQKVFEHAGFKIVGFADWNEFNHAPTEDISIEHSVRCLPVSPPYKGPVYLIGKI